MFCPTYQYFTSDSIQRWDWIKCTTLVSFGPLANFFFYDFQVCQHDMCTGRSEEHKLARMPTKTKTTQQLNRMKIILLFAGWPLRCAHVAYDVRWDFVSTASFGRHLPAARTHTHDSTHTRRAKKHWISISNANKLYRQYWSSVERLTCSVRSDQQTHILASTPEYFVPMFDIAAGAGMVNPNTMWAAKLQQTITFRTSATRSYMNWDL